MYRNRFSLAAMALLLTATACVDDVTAPEQVDPDFALLEENRKADFTLTILHSNDGESDLLPDGAFKGVARFARTVDDLRAEATQDCVTECGVILLSSGDNFLAGPEFNASLENGVPFFDAQAQDMIGFDASAIGNHEFDFGPDVLADYIESFSMTAPPFLSANLDFGGEPRLSALEGQGRIASSTIIEIPVFGPRSDDDDDDGDDDEERVARIGLIGATTPELRSISSPRNVVVLQNVADLINREARRLRRQGVDKIVLMSHLQGINSDLDLLPLLRDVDVAIAGGGDELLANDGDLLLPGDEGAVFGPYPIVATDRRGREVPVITTSGSYGYVGRLEVQFKKNGQVVDWAGGPVRIEGAPDPTIEAAIEAPVAAAVATLQATVIGNTNVTLDGTRSLVRTQETNMGNLAADALRWQASQLAASFGAPTPDVGLQNGGGIRNSVVLPAGSSITEFDTFQILPFPNFVTIIPNISRDQFKQILERAVSAVEFTSGRFTQVSGFSFNYDPNGTPQQQDPDGNITTAGARILDVTLDDGTQIVVGGQVQAGADLTIATIDFLARGGDGYPYFGAPFTSVGVTYQQSLRNYIQDGLGGTVDGAAYQPGGEGRITTN